MGEKKSSFESKNLSNLIAIGAFSWLLLLSSEHLLSRLMFDLGIVSGLDPVLLFWTQNLLPLIIMAIILRLSLRRTWNRIESNSINIKSDVVKLGICIVIIQIFQFLDGLYASDYLFQNHENTIIAYLRATRDFNGLAGLIIDGISTLTLPLLFIKWKE